MIRPHGIYVPGLGDHRSLGQDSAMAAWPLVSFEYLPLQWAVDEPFETKLRRLTNRLDQLYAETGRPVVLMGSSAGASAIINAYVQRKDKVACLIYICGKINNPGAINARYFHQNPAFKDSIFGLQQSLKKLTPQDKAKMLSIRSRHDGLIPAADTQIPGVTEKVLPTIGHALSIAYALIFYRRPINRFIKSHI